MPNSAGRRLPSDYIVVKKDEWRDHERFREALEEIYRDVNVGGIGPVIAAKALRRGVWADEDSAAAPHREEQ